ncbi:MAG: hypothetical protein PUC65_14600 [Clostridiales bacterium]|nr:hypothetical protein [Clostridiales bacterium]
MFDKEYSFKGKHAKYVTLLTAEIGESKLKLFEKNIDVYAMAAVVGFCYNIRATKDNGTETTKIFTDAFNNNKSQIESNYRMIMLLHDKNNVSFDERVARAFKYDNNIEKRKTGDEIFDSYVLGGVEKIFEKIFDTLDATRAELDLDKEIRNLYSFLEEFELRYQAKATDGDILNLCKYSYD